MQSLLDDDFKDYQKSASWIEILNFVIFQFDNLQLNLNSLKANIHHD